MVRFKHMGGQLPQMDGYFVKDKQLVDYYIVNYLRLLGLFMVKAMEQLPLIYQIYRVELLWARAH